MFRGVAPAIALFIGLVPIMAQAQTNIDQGKSPAEIFANDCATCHKSARGLANGRGSSGLASFLAEHYTASKDQAAALAAYVMGAGGGEAAPAARGPKPASAPDRNRASAEPGTQPTRAPRKARSGTACRRAARTATGDRQQEPPHRAGAHSARATAGCRRSRAGPVRAGRTGHQSGSGSGAERGRADKPRCRRKRAGPARQYSRLKIKTSD